MHLRQPFLYYQCNSPSSSDYNQFPLMLFMKPRGLKVNQEHWRITCKSSPYMYNVSITGDWFLILQIMIVVLLFSAQKQNELDGESLVRFLSSKFFWFWFLWQCSSAIHSNTASDVSANRSNSGAKGCSLMQKSEPSVTPHRSGAWFFPPYIWPKATYECMKLHNTKTS